MSDQSNIKENTLNDILIWENFGQETKQFDLSLFKIWIIFEKFVSESFRTYTLGGSYNGKQLKLKIAFRDESHLNQIITYGQKNTYIDYIDVAQKISKAIFEDNNDPFYEIFKDSQYDEIKQLRNFIAHESSKSEKNYKEILNKYKIKEGTEINEFLQHKTKKNISFFSYYLKWIREKINYLYEPF